jgi:hypothetical protein
MEETLKEQRLKLVNSAVFILLYVSGLSIHVDITRKQARKIVEADSKGIMTFEVYSGKLFISEDLWRVERAKG